MDSNIFNTECINVLKTKNIFTIYKEKIAKKLSRN